MKTATSKIVTALDVSVVVLASVAGVFCGIVGLNTTRELNGRLRKVSNSPEYYVFVPVMYVL